MQQTILQAFLSSLVYKMFECVLFKLKRMFPSMTICCIFFFTYGFCHCPPVINSTSAGKLGANYELIFHNSLPVSISFILLNIKTIYSSLFMIPVTSDGNSQTQCSYHLPTLYACLYFASFGFPPTFKLNLIEIVLSIINSPNTQSHYFLIMSVLIIRLPSSNANE